MRVIGKTACEQIAAEVMAERMLGPKDFFGTTRLRHVVDARVEAIKRMKEFTKARHYTIAAVMKREVSFIRYHLSETNRIRRSCRMMELRYARIKGISANIASSCTPATAQAGQIA